MDAVHFASRAEAVQRPLRRFLTALCCGNMHMADDLAQETLIKAYLACNNLIDDAKFDSWIFKIAYTTFINGQRANKPTVSIENALNACSDQQADATFKYQPLYDALQKIAPKERMSILLFYMQGYSVKEIAAITLSSAEAVKQQLSRGRQHLRLLIKNE